MAECKVLKLSSHLASSQLFRHLSHRQLARSHQQANSSLLDITLVIITCLPHIHHPAVLNVVCNSPPFRLPSLDPRICWNHQLVSIAVVIVSSSNHNCITMYAATIAFMDIKSASKAHLAEHKFDDRILTTEYYEPSSMHHASLESGSGLMINNKINSDSAVNNSIGDMKDSTSHGRFTSTSSHGSSDDHSPGRTSFYDRVSTSQSGNRTNSETAPTEFIRRTSYHSNDIRGRQRDRHFRNNPYLLDRSNPISHHRWYETSPSSSSSRNNHYNTNTNNNSIFQQPDSSYDRHNSSDLIDTSPSAVTTSISNTIKDSKGLFSSTQTPTAVITNSEQSNVAPYKSKLLINNHHHHHHLKTIKSRSGSESPISGRSSRSHSRSPSSCSSTSSHTTTPTSSHSSPVSGGGGGEIVTHSTPSSNHHHHHHHHHRHIKSNSTGKSSTGNIHHQRHRRNLQVSLTNVPLPNSIDKPASTTSSLSSSGSVSGSNPVVHSEDNRPLAICVKNLPLRSSDTSLKDGLFHEYKKHGKVTWVKVVGQSHERYALVCFKKPEDVEKALEVSQDKLFFGCKIEVQPYQGYDVDDNEFRPYEAEIDEYQSKSTRTLFIGNLEKHVTVAELRKAFEVFGEILEIDIKKQGSSPYAFCQYADIVSVVKAVRKMDGEHFGSTRIKLGFGKSMPTTCVWLDGILDGVSEHYLTQQFSRFGAVQKVAIDRDRKTALVSFDQIQCAQQAVKETRGTAIRGRKLQVDYASRECVDAFYARLEKLGVQPANINVESLVIPGNSMVRHTFNTSRSRASSFSRPGNPVSGAASPTSTPSAGSTPRHHSSSGSLGKKFRYAAAGSPEFYDSNEYLDTYGSSYDHERTTCVDSDLLNDGEPIFSSVRRRCDKSPAGDIRQVQRLDTELVNSGITSTSIRRRCERSPGDMRILETQRHKILDQLEKCPSSGAMTSSVNYTKPNRRPSTDSLSRYQHMDSYQTMIHKRRKTSATASTSSSSSNVTLNDNEQPNIILSKSRGHQLHSNHSCEASGGESEHGSRSGTPLFDERPDNTIDPRRPPITINRSVEPMNLPLPKFAQQFHQQLKQNNQLLPATHATSNIVGDKHENSSSSQQSHHNSSLKNRSMSPSPQQTLVRSHSNSLMPPIPGSCMNTDMGLTSPRPPSMISNSSDSEQELGSITGPNSSPSLEERLKKFTEDYDSWSSNGRSSSSSHYMNSFRHSVPEIAVPETPELLRNVLKNSMFDEDSKRLENIGDKYVTQSAPILPTTTSTATTLAATITTKNAFGGLSGNPLNLSGTSSPLMTLMNSNLSLAHPPETLNATTALCNSLGKLHMPAQQPVTITTMIHQRLGSSGTGSPMNSPNTASPYNSPNPSSASSISSIKGLQYPFPTHSMLSTSPSTSTTNTSTAVSTSTTAVATTTSVSPASGPLPSLNCLKPKTSSCALGKNEDVAVNNIKKEVDVKEINEKKNHARDRRKTNESDEIATTNVINVIKEENVKKEKESSILRKEKDVKKDSVCVNVNEEKKSKSSHKKSSKDEPHHDVDETILLNREQQQNKRRVSFEDVSSVDSANEQQQQQTTTTTMTNHVKDTKHHDTTTKSNSKHHHHHHHHHHKKSSGSTSSSTTTSTVAKEKIHSGEDENNHGKSKMMTNDVSNSKDMIFDELKRNSKENIIRVSEKIHKSKKHNHNYHRENNTKDKENQTQVSNFNDTDDDTDDSDAKKASFFDIPDDAPNISMYDKVKARSCKNLKKQEEEKKIKDKFSALKQSRAKRERKRLNTSDDDTDSDMNDPNSSDMFQMKYRKSHLSGSEDVENNSESEMLNRTTSTTNKTKTRNQFSVCDDESSESGITMNDGHRKRHNKFLNRKMSRNNVIDSSDDDDDDEKIVIVKQEMQTSDFDELKKQDDVKNHNNNKHSSNGSKKRHHDKSKDEKINKKSKKLSKEIRHTKQQHSSSDNTQKRDDKMEDIFGPISDDDIKSDVTKNNFTTALADIKKEEMSPILDNVVVKVEVTSSSEQQHNSKDQLREESRKRKEKRRREREKQREIIKEEKDENDENNSVDLDEAGRALEAQLMSDNDQQQKAVVVNNNNNNSHQGKIEDIFRFTDGDDEMKRDHNHDGSKKKKKKKRAREERSKHHHNHHHYEPTIKHEIIDNENDDVNSNMVMKTSSAFNNNNITKIRHENEGKIGLNNELKPSVPSLIDETPSRPQPVVTTAAVAVKKELKTKENVIPGFGAVVDETIHEKAVLSIAKELEKKTSTASTISISDQIMIKDEKKLASAEDVKASSSSSSTSTATTTVKVEGEKVVEEKSRVVISQEETEDAVAALLGESFSMAIEDDYNDPYDVPITVTNEGDSLSGDNNPSIPPEEDEEMKKAIMSLNPEIIDNKPDTPQSEHELQIDTDIDEAAGGADDGDEEESSNQPFDNPPKTPDVDMAQMEKEKVETPSLKIEITQDLNVKCDSSQLPSTTPVKEVKVVEKSSEKKDEIKARYQSHFQPASTNIPTKEQLPALKSSSVESQKNRANSSTTLTSTPSQKIVLSPNQPTSPKIIAIPTKNDNKTILIHSPSTVVKITPNIPQQPQPIVSANVQTINNTNSTYSTTLSKDLQQKHLNVPHQSCNKQAPSTTVVSDNKKVDIKVQQQHMIHQQSANRQSQIIYPPVIATTTTAAPAVVQPTIIPTESSIKASCDVKDSKPEQWQQNVNSVIQKTSENVKDEKKSISEIETSHDEDEFDENSADSSMEKETNGSRKVSRGTGRQQRGRKAAVVTSPQPLADDVVTSRRGGKATAANKRGGRGGRTANSRNVVNPPLQTSIMTAPSMPSPAVPPPQPSHQSSLRQQKTSESDVYEFHDDSGEELMKTGDAQRPRLIMTIKSSTVTTSVNTQPIVTASSASPTTVVVQSSPISTSINIQQQPSITTSNDEITQQQVPSPSASDDFAQPNANNTNNNSNTRKSRRLQEKDGTRTSVDDTIDDVIRNMTPNQNQQQLNNRRATRQTTPTVIPVNVAVTPASAVVVPTSQALNDGSKKSIRNNKKQQKDRKISDTSESSDCDKKSEVSTFIQPVSQTPPVTVTTAPKSNVVAVQEQIQKQHPEILVSQQHQQQKPHQKESSELLQLIDPVTGELQKMTQSKEGQYVPVSDNRQHLKQQQHHQQAISLPQVDAKSNEGDKKVNPSAFVVQMKVSTTPVAVHESMKTSNASIPSTTSDLSHVIKPPVITQNPTYTKPPQPLKTYVLGSQGVAKSSHVVSTSVQTPPATVISSQGIVKINPTTVQHPSTIYNLPNIIPATGGKYIQQPLTTPKTIMMPVPHSIHSNQQPQQSQILQHQKIPSNGQQQPQIVIHSQPHPVLQQPQPGGNLMINIPTSSASSSIVGGQSIPSPRGMQVKQVIQRSAIPSQVSQQQQQPPVPVTTANAVLMKSGGTTHHVVATNPEINSKTQTTYIHQGAKIIQGPSEGSGVGVGTPMSYISGNGGREIIYVGANVQKQTIYPNYQPNKYTHQQQQPSPTLQKPPTQGKVVEKIPSQQPSVSVTHIQMPPQQQQQQQQQPKVYFTNSGQVITNVPPSITGQQQSSEANERHQQWLTHEKIQQQQQQPLKTRYIMENYDEAHRTQIQSEQRVAAVQQQQQHHGAQAQVKRNYVIENPPSSGGAHLLPSPSQPQVHHATSSVVNQPIIPPQNKAVIGLNQAPQILTGAVASPPLKAHLTSQQPIVTGASSSRVAIPTMSPKDHPRHFPPESYDDTVMRPPYLMTKIFHHQQPSPLYMRGGPDFARLPSRIEPRDLAEMEEQRGASPPLELRRTTTMPLQSPSDRITDSPMMAPLYLSPRIPQPYFYEGDGMKPLPVTEPPPAHRAHTGNIPPPTTVFTAQPAAVLPPTVAALAHLQREADDSVASHQTKDADGNVRYQIVYSTPPAQSLVAPTTNNRPIQLTTPPIASQVPLHADTLSRLLERYPLMWQGLLALKTEQAAVQMHFVFGNKKIAKASLPFNSDHTTPPLRIAQRMRLEPSQIEGVARKMQITDEHCVLLALPCGFDYGDVLRQTENLQVSFINYLQQKQAAGIINIADPGSQNASYVVHIFPSCEFANESLERIAPDLMYKVANISHLLIVIATV
ncbi:CLUMA_CG014204, isoform B [Clunio marinus]|uniref:CLUMA_CG014204, isoform B n=1 Tax=Clunio marinus TaxID=568069 RepID=A0A1J1INF2_9DIPT|nr:CLUMA_CG014204, isoform B [Clunio marinus]